MFVIAVDTYIMGLKGTEFWNNVNDEVCKSPSVFFERKKAEDVLYNSRKLSDALFFRTWDNLRILEIKENN